MLKYLLYLIVFIIILLFGFANNETVLLKFIPNIIEFSLPLHMVIFISIILGMIICYFSYAYQTILYKIKNFLQNRKIIKLEKNIKQNNNIMLEK